MSKELKRFELPLEGSKLKQEVLDEIIRRVVEVAQPEKIILFGSAARGDMTHDSDVDLLVVKSGVKDRTRLAQDIHLSFWGLLVPVDVIVVTPEDIEKFAGGVGTIIPYALEEGKVIYGS